MKSSKPQPTIYLTECQTTVKESTVPAHLVNTQPFELVLRAHLERAESDIRKDLVKAAKELSK